MKLVGDSKLIAEAYQKIYEDDFMAGMEEFEKSFVYMVDIIPFPKTKRHPNGSVILAGILIKSDEVFNLDKDSPFPVYDKNKVFKSIETDGFYYDGKVFMTNLQEIAEQFIKQQQEDCEKQGKECEPRVDFTSFTDTTKDDIDDDDIDE